MVLGKAGVVACVVASACWTSPVVEAPQVARTKRTPAKTHVRCEQVSREASLPPAEGGYRRLDPVGRDSLRAAIRAAIRGRYVEVRGIAFKALAAAVHDTREDLVACIEAGRPVQTTLHLMIDGERNTGALVASVSAADLPPSAERCIADVLQPIELPPSDGPGYLDIRISTEDPCAGTYTEP